MDGGQPVFPKPLPARALEPIQRDSSRSVAVRPDGSIGMWDLRTGRETRCLRTGVAPHTIAIHPDGRQLAVGLRGARGRRRNLGHSITGKKVTELPVGKAGYV